MENKTREQLDITQHQGKVTWEERCAILRQNGLVIWFTGLSGSGKSTIAVELERRLVDAGRAVYRLDGDNIRFGLNSDLGFTDADRDENIRRIAEVAALFKDAGLITLVSFISPFRTMREFARAKAGNGAFVEVYVNAHLETCVARDPKGLYRRAISGEIPNFTGVSSPYEEPDDPEITIRTEKTSVSEAVQILLDYLEERIKQA